MTIRCDSTKLDGSLRLRQYHCHRREEITWSRRVARFLARYRWYYNKERNQHVSLEEAWDHYEHVTLARCFVDQPFVRAPQGERNSPTELYPLWATPLKELMDFGVSVRMYFSTLWILAGILALSGLWYVPLMVYFWNYGEKDGVHTTVRASAICDETEWVVCDSCNADYASEYPEYRLDGTHVQKNVCNFDDWLIPGLLGYAGSVLLAVLFAICFLWVQRHAEIVLDEDVQTASDYSVKVCNPPPDALDPEEWRLFLQRFGPVTVVTIAVDNAQLLRALLARRKLRRALARKLPLGTDMTDQQKIETAVAAHTGMSVPFLFPSATKLNADIQQIEQYIYKLLQRDYKAVAVFATFETERGQRDALHALSTGKLQVWWNRLDTRKFEKHQLRVRESPRASRRSLLGVFQPDDSETRVIQLPQGDLSRMLQFRGQHVLRVKEACEANDVRWQDLQTSYRLRVFGYVGTTLGMIAFVSWSGFFVKRLVKRHPGTLHATLFIAITNVVVPIVCEFMNNFESHATEGQRQTSLYVKIALFRWFNSAVVLSIVSSFIESISIEDGNETEKASLAYKVYPVIFAEMFFSPLLQLLDPVENFRKHVLAPRARDQEEMNGCFTGTRLELAERYTDATKVIFVALFYSSILPESFFLAAAALVIQYGVGKFCLLRLWRASPDIGFRLARLSRNYFFSSSLVAHMVMSAYWWSGFPYDNVCYDGGEGYTYCNQNFFSTRIFPPLPRFQQEGQEWMTESQEFLTSLYGWTSLVVIFMAILALVYQVTIPRLKGLFSATYEPDGADQGISFSSIIHLQEVHGYIPQIRDDDFVHPLLACNLEGIDKELVGWKDPILGFEPHNLANDAYEIIGGKPLQPVFSIVKQWAPKQSVKR